MLRQLINRYFYQLNQGFLKWETSKYFYGSFLKAVHLCFISFFIEIGRDIGKYKLDLIKLSFFKLIAYYLKNKFSVMLLSRVKKLSNKNKLTYPI